jgi:hypothetical protein
MKDGEQQTIRVRLNRPDELFEMAQADLFSEYRNFLTGVDYCISELRGRRSRSPVRLEIALPAAELDETTADRLSRALIRYCDHRVSYNTRERRAVRFDGISSLRVGLPVTALGLVLIVIASKIGTSGDTFPLVLDHLGWVLAWVGLWFPLDVFLFNPLMYGRENRVLALLRAAQIVVEPWAPSPVPTVTAPTA